MSAGPLYSVDTSALIDGLERYYFEAAFPGLWENIADLVAAGRFFISEEVWVEKRDNVVKERSCATPTSRLTLDIGTW